MKTDERLTEHSPNQTPVSKKSICSASPMFCHDYSCNECPIGEMINRLCEYEDTGLTPEDIVRGIKKANLNERRQRIGMVLCRGRIPDSCAACRASYLIEQANGQFTRYCPMTQQDVSNHDDDRPDNCFFLKQLPDKHGDLIDRDDLIADRVKNDPVVIAAKCATTIIEAEGVN